MSVLLPHSVQLLNKKSKAGVTLYPVNILYSSMVISCQHQGGGHYYEIMRSTISS